MKCSYILIIFFLSLFSLPALAEDNTIFDLSCDKVDSVIVDLAYFRSPESPIPRQMIGCQIMLTDEGGNELETLRLNAKGEELLVTGGDIEIMKYDTNVRSLPPQLFFTVETWAEARAKLMAICGDKMPQNIPSRVLNHRAVETP